MNSTGSIASVADLKKAIQNLEEQQEEKGQLLKDHVLLIYERLKPANIIRNTLKDLLSSFSSDGFPAEAAGIAGGYFARKFFVGKSSGTIRNLIGSLLQYGVSEFLARNTDMIKSAALAAFDFVFRKRRS